LVFVLRDTYVRTNELGACDYDEVRVRNGCQNRCDIRFD
jgi:hypothetical protein